MDFVLFSALSDSIEHCLGSYDILNSLLHHCNRDQITVQRTELNSPLGLEVQLHITEALCPALSEPGKLCNVLGYMFNCWSLKYETSYMENSTDVSLCGRVTCSSALFDRIICLS